MTFWRRIYFVQFSKCNEAIRFWCCSHGIERWCEHWIVFISVFFLRRGSVPSNCDRKEIWLDRTDSGITDYCDKLPVLVIGFRATKDKEANPYDQYCKNSKIFAGLVWRWSGGKKFSLVWSGAGPILAGPGLALVPDQRSRTNGPATDQWSGPRADQQRKSSPNKQIATLSKKN